MVKAMLLVEKCDFNYKIFRGFFSFFFSWMNFDPGRGGVLG